MEEREGRNVISKFKEIFLILEGSHEAPSVISVTLKLSKSPEDGHLQSTEDNASPVLLQQDLEIK